MILCFDLDGTLVDTEEWIINAQLKAFKKNNLKINKRLIYEMWGLALKNQIKLINPKIKKEDLNRVRVDFEKIREETISKVKVFKNTKKILKLLSKKYTICLLSNNSHQQILSILNLTKIDKNIFTLIIGTDDVKRGKPFPDEIYKTEKKLKKRVRFMIGDSQQDIKTAEKAGVKSIIILNAPKQVWKDLKKADFIIKDISELPSLLKEVKRCHNI